MNELLLNTLENEIREEYHIPPYFENLQNLIKEANAWFSQLENDIRQMQDHVRLLLKRFAPLYKKDKRLTITKKMILQSIMLTTF